MTEELQQILVAQTIQILVTLFVVGVPAFIQFQKWRQGEREEIKFISEKAEAETVNIWQKTYEELRSMLVARDKEVAELRESDSRHVVEMNNLKIEVANLRDLLEKKTASEAALREENARLKEEVSQERTERERESEASKIEIHNLKSRIAELETQISELKKENQNA